MFVWHRRKPVTEVLGTAAMLGVSHVFEMGGAQAIAAFAFGTRTVPRADRNCGARQYLRGGGEETAGGRGGHRFHSGPHGDSDHRRGRRSAALRGDLLAQAEHDVDASAVLLTVSKRLRRPWRRKWRKQLATLPTAAVARKAIGRNSAIVLVQSLDEAVEISTGLRRST